MAISGLVVTLSDDDAAATVAGALARDPRLRVGERFGRRLAVVAQTPSPDGDRALWEHLRGTPGVAAVDVAYVHLDEPGCGIAAAGRGECPDADA